MRRAFPATVDFGEKAADGVYLGPSPVIRAPRFDLEFVEDVPIDERDDISKKHRHDMLMRLINKDLTIPQDVKKRVALASKVKGRADQDDWFMKQVQSVFNEFDQKGTGKVSLEQLKRSLISLNIRVDDKMFAQYLDNVMPAGVGASGVGIDQFLAFHQAVWANQPAAVRRFLGAPVANEPTYPKSFLATKWKDEGIEVSGLDVVDDMAPGSGLREAGENERVLRRAFERYCERDGRLRRDALGHLDRMIAILKDLGLEVDIGNLAAADIMRAAGGQSPYVSFHDFAECHNKIVLLLEKIRATTAIR